MTSYPSIKELADIIRGASYEEIAEAIIESCKFAEAELSAIINSYEVDIAAYKASIKALKKTNKKLWVIVTVIGVAGLIAIIKLYKDKEHWKKRYEWNHEEYDEDDPFDFINDDDKDENSEATE